MVKGRYDGKYVLPGGKREQGNMDYIKDEQCWHTITREFKEEVDEDLNDLCHRKCKYFDSDVFTHLQVDKLKNQNTLRLVQDKFVQENGVSRIPRKIRVFYLEINCQDVPDVSFGRFHLYETSERKWIDLEQITQEIIQRSNKQALGNEQLVIASPILATLKQFCNRIIFTLQQQFKKNQLMLTFDHIIDLNSDKLQQQTQMPLLGQLYDKLMNTQILLRQVNKNIRLFPIFQKDESFIFAI